MMVSWRVVETDNKALPVNSYAAKYLLKVLTPIQQVLPISQVFTGGLWEMTHQN